MILFASVFFDVTAPRSWVSSNGPSAFPKIAACLFDIVPENQVQNEPEYNWHDKNENNDDNNNNEPRLHFKITFFFFFAFFVKRSEVQGEIENLRAFLTSLKMIRCYDDETVISDHDCQNFQKYESFFQFRLDNFQKRSICALDNGDHLLVTANTGAGKTVIAQYALMKYKTGIVYTAPIKALLNQKFFEFSTKSRREGATTTFSLLTGDIKYQLKEGEVDCTLMTTEILRNVLFGISSEPKKLEDLKCVILDEVHYINDPERGNVWEQVIMKLATMDIQIVCLSATIRDGEMFCQWLRDISKHSSRGVSFVKTDHRPVPLREYCFWKFPPEAFEALETGIKLDTEGKRVKIDIETKKTMERLNGRLDPLRNQMEKCESLQAALLRSKKKYTDGFVLDQLVNCLLEDDKLPAVCFLFSKNQISNMCLQLSSQVVDQTVSLQTAAKVRKFLSLVKDEENHYSSLDEFSFHTKLWHRGFGCHHSGMLPIMKEMTELLFQEGNIKFLLATESCAIGLNMPARTTVFLTLRKYASEAGYRYLYPHEYTQMAGRAGRRGLDTEGNVVHACNFMVSSNTLPKKSDYEKIVSGVFQNIESKFKISEKLIFDIMRTHKSIDEFVLLSLCHRSTTQDIQRCEYQTQLLEKRLTELKDQQERGESSLEIEGFERQTPKEKDQPRQRSCASNERAQLLRSLKNMREKKQQLEEKFNDLISKKLEFLMSHQFIEKRGHKTNAFVLSSKGIIASRITELNCLFFSEILLGKCFLGIPVIQTALVLAFLIGVTGVIKNQRDLVTEETFGNWILPRIKAARDNTIERVFTFVKEAIEPVYKKYNDGILTENVSFSKSLLYLLFIWCESETMQVFLEAIRHTFHFFWGDFYKIVTKTVRLSLEIETLLGGDQPRTEGDKMPRGEDELPSGRDQGFSDEIQRLLMKWVAKPVSLYVHIV